MKAIRVSEYGGPSVLKLEEVPAPQPGAYFASFGGSALQLRLVCYVGNFRDVGNATDCLNSAIRAKFKAAGIDIPFPTSAVHLTSTAGKPLSL